MSERRAWTMNTLLALLILVLLTGGSIYMSVIGGIGLAQPGAPGVALFVTGLVLLCVVLPIVATGLMTVQPNQVRAVVLFGRYLGVVRQQGLWFTVPLSSKPVVSVRVRNFQRDRIKVNDVKGNPIEIAAVVVWRVVDTAKALFDVDEYENFVTVQSETALRHIATLYPYDVFEENELSLRVNTDAVSHDLQKELQERVAVAGVEVIEARLTHLAYASEIASAMLQRQQAEAVVAARAKIVEGAVGMVQMALQELQKNGVVDLDEERRAAMINNLMVAIVSERAAQPVINAGSLY